MSAWHETWTTSVALLCMHATPSCSCRGNWTASAEKCWESVFFNAFNVFTVKFLIDQNTSLYENRKIRMNAHFFKKGNNYKSLCTLVSYYGTCVNSTVCLLICIWVCICVFESIIKSQMCSWLPIAKQNWRWDLLYIGFTSSWYKWALIKTKVVFSFFSNVSPEK